MRQCCASVLLITPGFAADDADSTCIPPLQLLVRGLTEKGVRVEIIALQYPFRPEPYVWHGARVWPCNGQNRRNRYIITIWKAVRIVKLLKSRRELPEVAHSFWLGLAWLTGEWLRIRFDLSHYTTLMGQDVLREQNGFYLALLKRLSARRLIAISAFQNKVFSDQTGQEAGLVIGWGVEDDLNLYQKRDCNLVLGVGSLVPVKNWLRWLRIFALSQNKLGQLKGEIIGDGPEKDTLKEEIKRLGLSNQIQLVGALPRERVLERMRVAGVLLHTAQFEGYGMVVAEASACGLPAVGTAVGIMPELGYSAYTDEQIARLLIDALTEKIKPRQSASMAQTVEAYQRLWQLNVPISEP